MIDHRLVLALLALLTLADAASAQAVEAVGARALGMGGAFVAVADDSTATWWNPAGLAAGPFFDLAFGRAAADLGDRPPAWRQRATWAALGTPPFGLSYYRLRVIDIGPGDPTGQGGGDREDRRVAVPASSLSASQFGATFVQTVLSGVHAGTTLKYVRVAGLTGDVVGAVDASASQLLDAAQRLDGGTSGGAFDLDVGILAVKGPVRLGSVVRNVREPAVGGAMLPRQVRIGVAFDGERAGAPPITVALDADARTYQSSSGDRRAVALGAEGWAAGRRIGIRAGARFNTVGAEERAFTAGASAAIRVGLYVDGYVVRGGSRDERGWGVSARASF